MKNPQWAHRAWIHLVKCALKKTTITYSDLATSIGFGHYRLSRQLDPIYHYCRIHKLPPLSILAVEKATGGPSPGAFEGSQAKLESLRQQVLAKDWSKVATPSVAALAAAIPEK